MSALKDRLAEARTEAGLSQAQLAKAVGAGQSTIASIENGRNKGSSLFLDLARALNVNVEWLMDGAGPKKGHAGATPASVREPTAPWPFPDISERDVRALPPAHINALQGALALVIAELKLGVKVTPRPPAATRLVDIDSAADEFPMQTAADSQHGEMSSTVQPYGAGSLRLNQLPNVGHVPRAGYSANDQEFVSIPELDVRLAAGPLGIENYHETEIGEILFRRSFLESLKLPIERMRIVYADGDSMEPIIRNKGPMLFLEEPVTDVRRIDQRTVYAINLGGKMVVKCIQRERDGTLLAKSLNPAHPPFPLKLDNGQEVRIVGRILWSPYDLRNGVDERLL